MLSKLFLISLPNIMLNIVLFALILFAFSCSEKDNPVTNNYSSTGKSALLVFVENNDGLINSDSEIAFQFNKPQMLEIFSDLYGINVSQMDGMNLNDIIENFGEDWQINHIKDFAIGHYDTILTFKNNSASLKNLYENLNYFNDNQFNIDMVFCLHGNKEIVAFYDDELNIDEFSNYIKSNNIKLRMLYQTCCYAGSAMSSWEKSGIPAINGAIGLNNITIFSPGFFMEEWVKGLSFENAVNNAFQRDILMIHTYNNLVPVDEYILNQQNLFNSKQIIGGSDTKIKISDYLIPIQN
jgi:hypothetical protein